MTLNKMPGLVEDFKMARIVNMTTFAENGVKNTRPMTNFNEDPYDEMWFPTYKDTKKVRDILKDPRILINFPSSSEGAFWEIEGVAKLEKDEVTATKWKNWFLFWYPNREAMGWGLAGYSSLVDHRMIVNVFPKSVKLIEQETNN